jgi:hypothetical protein
MVTIGNRTVRRVCAASALLWLALLAAGTAAADRLTVVELYSAQGCPLCPPAEVYLGELAQRPDILPLAFHVDYWDYLGWPDRFAEAGHVRRQKRYSDRLGLPYVYTPQIVVDGYRQVSGGRRDEVEAEIAAAAANKSHAVEMTLTRLSPTMLRIEIPAGVPRAEAADIVLIGYDAMHETEIARGENSGMRLVNYHVVRDVKSIASWNGDRFELIVPMETGHGSSDFCAVLVQEAGQGHIIGAASIDMRGG